MVNNTKVLRLIGLAMRAGKVKFGSDSCMEAIIQNKIKVLLVAKDASERTKTNFKRLCHDKNIPIYEEFEEYDLSHAIGKQNKVIIGVCVNADVNDSYQIMRKVYPQLFDNGVEGYLKDPKVIDIKIGRDKGDVKK